MLFISYAHKDGAELAGRLKTDLERRGYETWLDCSRLAASASWSVSIEQALDKSNAVLALLSPGSFSSDVCRGEQLRALRLGKRVIPLLLTNDADRPVFLETKHYISFVVSRPYPEAFSELLLAISGGSAATLVSGYRETYVTAPRLPGNAVLRPEELQHLRQSVLKDEPHYTIAVSAVVGMGGVGKTTLAQMLCHDRVVQDAFPDGVIWVGLGRDIGDLVPKIREVGRALGDDPKHYDTSEGSSNRLRTILRKKSALIVLDDVWKLDDVEPFLADAPASCLLITTRQQNISISLRAKLVTVATLSETQSLEVLARWTRIEKAKLPREAALVVRECGRLPLALAMIGGLIYSSILKGRLDAWAAALHRLEGARLDWIRFPLEHYAYPQLLRAIQVSFEALSSPSQVCYVSMSVFPDDTPIPERVLQTYWSVDRYEMQETVDSWLDASMARRDDAGKIVMHDLQLHYVRQAASEQIAALHRQLVDRYSQICSGNWSACAEDDYLLQRLAWHMAGACAWRDLSALLLDVAFIRAKLDMLSYVELHQDFQWSSKCLSAIENPADQRLFSQIEGAVETLYGFVDRKDETLIAERWLDDSDGSYLIVTGTPAIGKTMFLRHIWVRRFREAIIIDSPQSWNSEEEFLIRLLHRISTDSLGGGMPQLRIDDGYHRLLSVVHEVVTSPDKKLCVLVDGVDEVRYLSEQPWAQSRFVHLLKTLSSFGLRFILTARGGSTVAANLPMAHILRLAEMDFQSAAMILRNVMQSQDLDVDSDAVEKLIRLSDGHPFTMRLIAGEIRNGKAAEDLIRELEGYLDNCRPLEERPTLLRHFLRLHPPNESEIRP
jgi:hypothetical protein